MIVRFRIWNIEVNNGHWSMTRIRSYVKAAEESIRAGAYINMIGDYDLFVPSDHNSVDIADVNVDDGEFLYISVGCGYMQKTRAEEYLKTIMREFRYGVTPDVKMIAMPSTMSGYIRISVIPKAGVI
jgi:hypothetical protein